MLPVQHCTSLVAENTKYRRLEIVQKFTAPKANLYSIKLRSPGRLKRQLNLKLMFLSKLH